MPTPEHHALSSAIIDALAYAEECGENIVEHQLWQIRQMVENIKLEAMTVSERAALIAVLIPVHARILAARKPPVRGRPVLRVIGSGGAALREPPLDFGE